MDFTFYKSKKVFLTGHTGFKGSWLLAWLHHLGADVKGYSLVPENENDLYNSINGDKLCKSIIGDLRDKQKLENEILTFQPDFIFHLAAQPLVRLSYEIPKDTFEVNVIGTINVLDAVRKLENPCSVVLITTDKVYENFEWHYPYRENDRLGGYDPYSASKACAELAISCYRNSFFNLSNYDHHKKGIASARSGNVIGGGDWAKDRIIPDIVRALRSNKTINIRNPKSIRPWQHVLEPLSGYLQLGLKLNENPTHFSESWNFGPHTQDNLYVEDIVKKAIEIWGRGEYICASNINQPHEAGLLKLDISKTVNELGWKPKWDAKQAIEKTMNWYFCDQSNIQKLIKSQFDEFLNS